MSREDLYVEFQVARIDQSEFEQVLTEHFGGSVSESPKEIQYIRQGSSQPGLIVRYSKDGQIKSVEVGAGIGSDDVALIRDKIERQLLTQATPHIGQVAIFACVPTVGFFRYRDLFQLVPMPANAPQPPFLMGDHPLLLQFIVPGSVDFSVSLIRRTRIGRELELLCCALTTQINGSIGTLARHQWCLVPTDNLAVQRCVFAQVGYTWPDANGIAPAYAEIDAIDPLSKSSAAEYYLRMGISAGQTLDIPDTFEKSLDSYFSLSRIDKDRFLRAAFWFQYARRASSIGRSGAFTALVSAVEALMPNVASGGNCKLCKKSLGPGPTRQFADFVDRYAPGTGQAEKSRRNLYSLRSALSHGGRLLHLDRHGWGGGMTSTALSEWDDEKAMWQVVRLVLVNWLHARASGEPSEGETPSTPRSSWARWWANGVSCFRRMLSKISRTNRTCSCAIYGTTSN